MTLATQQGQSGTNRERGQQPPSLDCVVLEPDPQLTPSTRPPVRVFLGTERAQHRAERVFVWSILQVRDPARRYEIYLLKDLDGFDREGWTTGFTNYRFAIPHLAGGEGRAIYNDTDQIYLEDPGKLFDLDMGDHGVLAVSPRDLSVALMDCARALELWDLESVQRLRKKALLARSSGRSGFVGHLEAGWNTRDHGEYNPDDSKVYHFTTLHTQPWCPFPERFVYPRHPDEELWLSLERSADEAGFHPFSRERPSFRFRAGRYGQLPEAAAVVDHGSFNGRIAELSRQARVRQLSSGSCVGGVTRTPCRLWRPTAA